MLKFLRRSNRLARQPEILAPGRSQPFAGLPGVKKVKWQFGALILPQASQLAGYDFLQSFVIPHSRVRTKMTGNGKIENVASGSLSQPM